MGSVTNMTGRDRRQPRPRSKSDDMWLRRQGVNLIPNLPEDPADALAVLRYAEIFYRQCVMKDASKSS